MKEFYAVVFLLLMGVGASTILRVCYDFVVRCKEAVRLAEKTEGLSRKIFDLRLDTRTIDRRLEVLEEKMSLHDNGEEDA